jgi:uncharacterized membrane protein YkvA (DUF1232 family)
MTRPDDIDSDSLFAKLRPMLGRLPFIVDMVAMYYAMVDEDTPMWARCVIAGALAYFLLPLDAIPDVLFPVGYTDDAGAIAVAMATVQVFVTPEHYRQARETLGQVA